MKTTTKRQAEMRVMEGLMSASLVMHNAIDTNEDFSRVKNAAADVVKFGLDMPTLEFAAKVKNNLDKMVSPEKQDSIIETIKAAVNLDEFLNHTDLSNAKKLSSIVTKTSASVLKSQIIKEKDKVHILAYLNGSLAAYLNCEELVGPKNNGCECHKSKESDDSTNIRDLFEKLIRAEFMKEESKQEAKKEPKESKLSIFDKLGKEDLRRAGIARRDNMRECCVCSNYTHYVDCESGRRVCSPRCASKQ